MKTIRFTSRLCAENSLKTYGFSFIGILNLWYKDSVQPELYATITNAKDGVCAFIGTEEDFFPFGLNAFMRKKLKPETRIAQCVSISHTRRPAHH